MRETLMGRRGMLDGLGAGGREDSPVKGFSTHSRIMPSDALTTCPFKNVNEENSIPFKMSSLVTQLHFKHWIWLTTTISQSTGKLLAPQNILLEHCYKAKGRNNYLMP